MEGGVICVSVRWTRYSNGYTYYVYELRQEKNIQKMFMMGFYCAKLFQEFW